MLCQTFTVAECSNDVIMMSAAYTKISLFERRK